MQVINVQQGSDKWKALRCGLISASRFKDIMTDPRAKKDKEAGLMSATSLSYMGELIGEITTGIMQEIKAAPLDWGNKYESSALTEYSFEHGHEVSETGIVIADDCMVGASPDGVIGIIGDGGMNEVKCPFNTKNHISNVMNGMDKDHMPQIQGNMWINGADWCDFISFDPRIDGKGRLYVQRIARDDEYIKILSTRVERFKQAMIETLSEKFDTEWKGVDVENILNQPEESE